MAAYSPEDGVGGLNVTCCTSFSPSGYKEYGKQFLESYVKHWMRPLTVFHDGSKPGFRHALICYRDLNEDEEACRFRDRFHKREGKSYHDQPVKFSRKAFAWSGMRHWRSWMLWFDADVIFNRDIDESFLSCVCPEKSSISYLARPNFAHSETGFIGFNFGDPRVGRLVNDMVSCYMGEKPEVFSLSQKHDSMVFDLCLGRSGIEGEHLNNLVSKTKEIHVWPQTILGRYSTHQKGLRLKQKIYGS